MSHGQKPRYPTFFPRMKDRGRKRGVLRVTLYDANWKPMWPPVIMAEGRAFRLDKGQVTVTGRVQL